MEIAKELMKKSRNMNGEPAVTIAVLGDSVTQGCFEIYTTGEQSLETVYEAQNSYGARLVEQLHLLYPNAAVQLIPAGISGDNIQGGLARLERDVLRFHPDLTVVSFGLNDAAVGGESGLHAFGETLKTLLIRLRASGSEVIFLTQNYMNTKTSPHIKEPLFLTLAEQFAKVQNSGILKRYYEEAKRVCNERAVAVCDLYAVWEAMDAAGVNTTALLSNHLNHPIREYHSYIAIKLLEMILGIHETKKQEDRT